MKRTTGIYVLWVTVTVLFSGCSGPKPDLNAVGTGRLGGCPDRPNCVSSEAREEKHLVAPLRLKGDPAMGWNAIRRVIGNLPRTTVIQSTDRYLHAECKSRLFGFIDDLELHLDPKTGVIAIRSASRVGFSDLGVNRRRIEALRQKLKVFAMKPDIIPVEAPAIDFYARGASPMIRRLLARPTSA